MADQGDETAGPAPVDSQTRARQIEDQLAKGFTEELGGEAPQAESDQPEEGGDEPATEAAAEESSPDSEEVEFEGDIYQVPSKLKEALLRESDYRRKTQEIARKREELDLQYQKLEQQNIERKFMEAVKEPVMEFNKIGAQLDQYRNLDWRQLPTEDLLRARAEMDRLEREQQRHAQAIEAKRGEFGKQQEELSQNLIRKGEEVLRQRIPGWNAEMAKGVAGYLMDQGWPAQEVQAIVEPRHALAAWKAQQWDKLQAERGNTLKKVSDAKVVKPGPSSRPMPSEVKSQLAFRKAMKTAKTSSSKARLIEDRLAAEFDRKH